MVAEQRSYGDSGSADGLEMGNSNQVSTSSECSAFQSPVPLCTSSFNVQVFCVCPRSANLFGMGVKSEGD
jgi:hypothetical protein